jgi:HSP90 family molecular chaperone
VSIHLPGPCCDNSDELHRSVADQLYSSRFRFIYELLQNADDASYEEGIVPTLTFKIRSDTLIVKSNEKGFTVANVRAICSTGESSKIDEKESTGEKGFGFKSVFGIANKVHIQSGKFSFRFEHQRGQDGIGMVVPIWTDPVVNLEENVGTRLTLHYAKSDQSSLEALLNEFAKIPSTVVFALRRIRTVSVEIDNVNSQSRTWTYQKRIAAKDQISIVTADSSVSKASKTTFKTFSTVVSEMPETELRAGQSESDIVLAFPIDSTGSPRIDSRGQHVFAFLPVQRVSGISVWPSHPFKALC